MPRVPWQRRQFKDWPDDAQDVSVVDVRRLYQSGFAGAKYNEAAWDHFRSVMPNADGERVCHDFKLADTGAGKLIIPFVHVLEMFPGCWPGRQGQARGDCVSWATRNAALLTMVGDIITGKPDETTGEVEGRPDVPAEGIADGVLSTESIYWYRGYDGDGWDCPTASEVACTEGGIVLRQKYPFCDLTTYSGSKAGLYGRKTPGADVQAVTKSHLIHQATENGSADFIRDMLFNLYGISTCGSEGIKDQRDANGVSRRSGNWSHAMAYVGFDDRPWAKTTYGSPLVLDLNSWAIWNSGPRDIHDSASMVPPDKLDLWKRLGIVNASTGNIMIPEGSCWVPYNDMKNREAISFGGATGFPSRTFSWAV